MKIMNERIGRGSPRGKYLASLIVMGVCLGPAAANASLLAASDLASDGQVSTAVRDTISGLQWLSPLATTSKTFDQAAAGVWAAAGYRHATTLEFFGLMESAGVAVDEIGMPASTYWLGNWGTESRVSPVKLLIGLLRPTYFNNQPSANSPFGQQSVYGVLADSVSVLGQTPKHDDELLTATDGVASVTIGLGSWSASAQDGVMSHLMVRTLNAVPEPPSMPSVALAVLAAWVGTRRSRTRA